MWDHEFPPVLLDLLERIIEPVYGKGGVAKHLTMASETIRAVANSYYLSGLHYILDEEDTTESYLSLALNLRFHAYFIFGTASNRRLIEIPGKLYSAVAYDMYEFAKEYFADERLYLQLDAELDNWVEINTIVATALKTISDDYELRDMLGFPTYGPFGTIPMPDDYFHNSDAPSGLLLNTTDFSGLRYISSAYEGKSSEHPQTLFLTATEDLILDSKSRENVWKLVEEALDQFGRSYHSLAFKLRQQCVLNNGFGEEHEDSGLIMMGVINGLDRLTMLDMKTDIVGSDEIYRNVGLRRGLVKGISRLMGRLEDSRFKWGFDVADVDYVEHFCSIYSEIVQNMIKK